MGTYFGDGFTVDTMAIFVAQGRTTHALTQVGDYRLLRGNS